MRRFSINITCATCKLKIEKILKNYPDINYSINIMEKMINIEADEVKYPNKKIIDIIHQAGFNAKEI